MNTEEDNQNKEPNSDIETLKHNTLDDISSVLDDETNIFEDRRIY